MDERFGFPVQLRIVGKKAIVSFSKGVIQTYDISNGRIVWNSFNSKFTQLSPIFNNNDNYVFAVTNSNNEQKVVKFSLEDGVAESIVDILDQLVDGSIIKIQSPRIPMQKDDLLYFTAERVGKKETSTNIYAYSMKTDSMVWRKIGFGKHFVQADPPIVFQNNLIVVSDKVFAFEKDSGKEIYSFYCPKELHKSTAPILIGDKVIIKGVNKSLLCFNALTGIMLWHVENAGGYAEINMKLNDDILQYTVFENTLYQIDIKDGSIINRLKPPGKNSSFGIRGHALDTNLNVIYFLDNSKMVAAKLL